MKPGISRSIAAVFSLILLYFLIGTLDPAYAESTVIEIQDVRIGGLEKLVAGQYARMIPSDAITVENGCGYSVKEEDLYWYSDKNGNVRINNNDYKFKAGRTYSLIMTVVADNYPNHSFKTGIKPVLIGLSSSDYSVSVMLNDGEKITFSVSFTAAGTCSYTPISDVRLSNFRLPKAGQEPDTESIYCPYEDYYLADSYFSNSTFDNGKYIADNNYHLYCDIKAEAGYSFSTGLTAYLGDKKADSVIRLKSDYVTLRFDYKASPISQISEINITRGVSMPYAGERPKTIYNKNDIFFEEYESCSINIGTTSWYTLYANSTKLMTDTERFVYGVKYGLTFNFTIKDPANYMFADEVSIVFPNDMWEPGSYTTNMLSRTPESVLLRVEFNARLNPDVGGSESSPADCYSYEDLKACIEDTGIRYIRVLNIPDTGNEISLQTGSGNYYPIVNSGTKTIILGGDAYIVNDRTSSSFKGKSIPIGLICNTGNLTIKGSGSLTYIAPEIDNYNAVIVNRGTLNIVDDVTIASYIPFTAYKDYGETHYVDLGSTAICQTASGAKLNIFAGNFVSKRLVKTKEKQTAVKITAGTANITGGSFYTDTKTFSPADTEGYGLLISGTSTNVSLGGGEYKGIILDDNKVIGHYLASGTVAYKNGAKVSNSAGTTLLTGTTNIYKAVTGIDIYINAPRSGHKPSYEIYQLYGDKSVRLLKGSESIIWRDVTQNYIMDPDDVFIAGHKYSVSIEAEAYDGYILNVTSAGAAAYTVNVNGTKQTVLKSSSNDYSRGFKVTADMGTCDFTVDEIECYIAPPKAGSVAASTALISDTRYKLMNNGIDWYDITAGRFLNAGETFITGHQYKVTLWIDAASGYKFALDDKGDCDIRGTVDDVVVKVYKGYEKDPEKTVVCTLDFTDWDPNILIFRIKNTSEPLAGERPSYDAVSGDPKIYTVSTITWKDSSGNTLSAEDSFDLNRSYTVTYRIALNKIGPYSYYTFKSPYHVFIGDSEVPSGNVTYSQGYLYVTQTYKCGSIGEVSISGKCGDNAYFELDGSTGTMTISGYGAMEDYKYSTRTPWVKYRDLITNVKIGEGITRIGTNTFYGCQNLTEVTAPDDIDSIGINTFRNCYNLQYIMGAKYVKLIEQYAFCADGKLTLIGHEEGRLDIPDCTKIGGYTFYECKSLRSLNTGNGMAYIGTRAFSNCTSLEYADIGAACKTIASYAFCGNTGLTVVEGCADLTGIGDFAFYGNGSLTKVGGCTKVTNVGKSIFRNCTKLVQVGPTANRVAFTSAKVVGEYAFSGCSSASLIWIGKNCTSVGKYAFQNTKALSKLYLKSSVIGSVGEYAFKGIKSDAVIYVPKDSYSKYVTMFKGKGQGSGVKITAS